MKIGFIGTGKLGMPCAEAIASKGHNVTGYDVAKRTSHQVTIMPTIKDVVEGRDIVFVAVPTPHDPDYDGRAPTAHLNPKDFNYDIVKDVLAEANKHMTKDQLLVLISTVLPGTTRKQFIDLVPNTRFVYNPYLIAMGSVAWDMVNPEMVMIGTEDGSATGDAKQLVDFYKTIMENNPRYEIGTWDECECIKVFYNTFISAKIGLVNMIQDVAQQQGNINVDVVTDALAKSTMRIMGPQYMKAGMGDGGGCHPRDNIALRYMADELGLGYDGSYSLLIGHYCEEQGFAPVYVDPLTGDEYDPTEPCVFLLAHSASTTYKYTGKTSADKLYCDIPNNSVVVDPWRHYVNENCKVIHYGNTRQLTKKVL